MATNAEILPFHHQTILTYQTAAALTNYGGVGGGSTGISTASQLAAAWSVEDHLFQQTELPVLTRSTYHMLRFAPYALPHRPQLQPVPPALYLQHAAAAAAVEQRKYVWHGAILSSIRKGVEAKLRLKRSSPSLFNCLVKRGIKKVQILSLRRSLKDLMLSVPALNSLNLSGCFNVTDVSLRRASSVDLPNLKILDLFLCKQITDTGLGRIAQHLKNLQTLDLGGCCNIANTALLLIAWSLKKFKHLNLRSCCISDQGIGHLVGLNKATAEGNLELEILGLQDCNRLNDEALGHIAQGLTAYLTESGSNLNSLDVSFCVKISDQALTHIAQNRYRLIIDQGIFKISKALSELEHLNIGQCEGITDKSLQTLAEELLNLMTKVLT
uniref:F-box/LRR-repeat protein 15-like leucin rich repeat domain-containing protein n=1 Tax=Glossina morsitans morsitans TaxID=37546 RepID=A0A1B0GCA2_GLOMM